MWLAEAACDPRAAEGQELRDQGCVVSDGLGVGTAWMTGWTWWKPQPCTCTEVEELEGKRRLRDPRIWVQQVRPSVGQWARDRDAERVQFPRKPLRATPWFSPPGSVPAGLTRCFCCKPRTVGAP